MNDHITSEEWRAYLAGGRFTSERLRLMSRVHAHLGRCETCRALHRALTRSSGALKDYVAAEPLEVEPAAYRAVADDAPFAGAEDCGALTIRVDAARGRFLYGTLSLRGDCEKYIFLPEADGSRLTDACDPHVWMALEDGRLRLSFPCPDGVRPEASVSVGEKTVAMDFDDHFRAELPLPEADFLLTVRLRT